MLLIGTIIGAVFAIICLVLAGLPLCCAILKPQGKIIAGIVIAIGIFVCFIPAITGQAQGSAAVDKMCDRCKNDATATECSEDDKEKAKEAVAALGILVAYIHAFGFVVIILGATAAGMGCCICCKCCKMAEDKAPAAGAPAVVGQVV